MNAHATTRAPVLLLGLGSSVLCDDGIGVHVVRSVAERARALSAHVAESENGTDLLPLLDGHGAAVVVEAIRMPGLEPGAVVVLDSRDFAPSFNLAATHRIDLPGVLSEGQRKGMRVPQNVRIVGIQIEDDHSYRDECTSAVAAAEPGAGAIALDLLEGFMRH